VSGWMGGWMEASYGHTHTPTQNNTHTHTISPSPKQTHTQPTPSLAPPPPHTHKTKTNTGVPSDVVIKIHPPVDTKDRNENIVWREVNSCFISCLPRLLPLNTERESVCVCSVCVGVWVCNVCVCVCGCGGSVCVWSHQDPSYRHLSQKNHLLFSLPPPLSLP
jgi:hypothetical protein